LPHARLGLEPFQLRVVSLEGFLGATAAEEREQLALEASSSPSAVPPYIARAASAMAKPPEILSHSCEPPIS
jgi:hypothetical protein